jgi:hypothetical protein
MVYTDLKPANIVLVRYENKKDSEITLYKNCYIIKLIDLASLSFFREN